MKRPPAEHVTRAVLAIQRKAASTPPLRAAHVLAAIRAPASGVLQRAASGSGGSGRSAGTLWDTFARYRSGQAETITHAFLAAGYTFDNASGAIQRAIRELGLNLHAHGTGDSDSGVQGNLDQDAETWVRQLTAWAASHPVGGSSGSSRDRSRYDPSLHDAKVKRKQEKAETKQAEYQVGRCEEVHGGKEEPAWDRMGIDFQYDDLVFCPHCGMQYLP